MMRKELTETFMMISNLKKIDVLVYKNIFCALRVKRQVQRVSFEQLRIKDSESTDIYLCCLAFERKEHMSLGLESGNQRQI